MDRSLAVETKAHRRETCAHCGLPAARPAADGLAFCCPGCRIVYDILHDEGLHDFYDLRQRYGGDARPATIDNERSFAEFDTLTPADGAVVEKSRLLVADVNCAACVWLLEKALVGEAGIVSATVDLPRRSIDIEWRPAATQLSAIARRLARLGYAPKPYTRTSAEIARRQDERQLWLRLGVAGAAAGNIMLLSAALYFGLWRGIESQFANLFTIVAWALATPVVFYSAWPFHRRAWLSLRHGRLHIDLPLSLGVLTGYFGSVWALWRGSHDVFFDSITALVFLLLVGRLILTRGQRRAEEAAEALIMAGGGVAKVYDDVTGTWREVTADRVQTGDVLLVAAGGSPAADGVVIAGKSYIDRSVLTGESVAVFAQPGDRMEAGCVNLGEPLHIRADATGNDTRVAELARLLRDAAQRRAPIVESADRLAAWFTAVTLVAAAATFVVWLQVDLTKAITAGVAVAVVMCPCALGLATSLSLGVAQGRAATFGIMVKGSATLQRLAEIDTLVLDKTGTLTEGKPEVVAWTGLLTLKDLDVRDMAAGLEVQSLHPFGRAIAAHGKPSYQVDDVREAHGLGIEGNVAGHRLRIGSERWLGDRVPARLRQQPRDFPHASPVWIEVDGTVAACVWLADRIHRGAAAAIVALKKMGVEAIVVSGDRQAAVAGVAAACGIERAIAEASPEAKLEFVKNVAGKSAMVGDGANDAAALAAAHAGIAVAGGVEAALAAADAYLLKPGIDDVVRALELSRSAMRTIRRNMILSVAYNGIGLVLAATGQIGPLGAALLMPLSSLTVVTSSFFQGRRP